MAASVFLAPTPAPAQDLVVGVNVVKAAAPGGRETRSDRGAVMKLRVGAPLVARGPAANIADAAFTAVELPGGRFRGFTSAGTTFAIDGKEPYDMGG